MKITPLNSYILILPTENVGRTEGGILIPEDDQEYSYRAEVIAVADKIWDETEYRDPIIKVGDIILHKSYGITSIKLEHVEHYLIKETDVLGLMEDEK